MLCLCVRPIFYTRFCLCSIQSWGIISSHHTHPLICCTSTLTWMGVTEMPPPRLAAEKEILMNWQRAKGWEVCRHQKRKERLKTWCCLLFSPSLLLIALSHVPLFTIPLWDLKDSCSNKLMLKILWRQHQHFSVYLPWVVMSYWITSLPKQSLYVSHVGVFNINTWAAWWHGIQRKRRKWCLLFFFWVIFVYQRPRFLWTNTHNKSIGGIFSSYKEIQGSDHTFVLHVLFTRGYGIQANVVCVCLFCCLTQLLCCWWSCLYWLCVWARECLRVFALGSSPFWFIGLLMDREAQEEQER